MGTFASKFALSKWFGSISADNFKNQLKKAIEEQYQTLAAENDMPKQLRSQINTAFDSLKQKIDRETETVLQDLEDTLKSLDRETSSIRPSSARKKQICRRCSKKWPPSSNRQMN